MNFTLVFPLVLGWLAGVFINYAADVLPHTRRLSRPACRDCQTEYSWIDYLSFRACRNCGIVRSLRTWIVQIVTVGAFAYVWLAPPKALGLPLGLIVLTYFAIITVIDLEHRLILHPTSLAGAALGLLVGVTIYQGALGLPLLDALGSSLLGGLIGFGFMYALYLLGMLVARYRARKLNANDEEEALGGGDVYLGGVLGLMLGSQFIINGLLSGILLGGVVSLVLVVVLLLRRRYLSQSLMTFIPYGPYLIAGAFRVLFLN